MKNISKILTLSLVAAMTIGCERDFLDVPASDSIEETSFWESETQARSYMQGLYMYMFPGYSAPSTNNTYDGGQFLQRYQTLDYVKYNNAFNDDWAMVKQYDFQLNAENTNSNWANFYSKIRLANYAIANANRLPSNQKHWEGVARFFRAAYYSNMVFTYGDVPYFDEVEGLSDADAMKVWCKARTSRVEIDAKVMEDFRYAMTNCAEKDGYCQVNKYVVAAMASRMMLREGTFLKYHNLDAEMAKKCLEFAMEASEMVMNSGVYSLADDFNTVFTSEDLSDNSEVIMARQYVAGQVTHATLSCCYSYGALSESQNGTSKSLAEAFLGADGLPIVTNYDADLTNLPKSEAEFFANRDPRLALTVRPNYGFAGLDKTPFRTVASGFVYNKFFDDRLVVGGVGPEGSQWSGVSNTTDAPCVRLAEVLLNECEAAYELGQLTQDILDKTINVIRDRACVMMPHVTLAGDHFEVAGVAVEDPKRTAIEALDCANGGTYTTDAVLWEIRRERRTELAYEGFRFDDLKRWNKLNYCWATVNPDICFGAYFDATTYSAIAADKVMGDATTYAQDYSNYIMVSTNGIRPQPDKKFYLAPVPSDQVVFYQKHGYELKQNEGY